MNERKLNFQFWANDLRQFEEELAAKVLALLYLKHKLAQTQKVCYLEYEGVRVEKEHEAGELL